MSLMESMVMRLWSLLVLLVIVSLCISSTPQTTERPPTTPASTAPSTTAPSTKPHSTAPPQSTVPSKNTAVELHEDGWKEMLKRASTDFYAKYAFYTSRTLAVTHPEVYLQADLIKGQSYPLHLTESMLRTHRIVSWKEIYPHEYPVFSFVDRRNFPLFLTLHSPSERMTQIDMASAYYVMKRLEGKKAQDLFIIYCNNENSYVYDEKNVVSMKTLSLVKAIEGNPVLILNETHVWYPLMKRDDTIASPRLKNIVKTFATDKKIPTLSKFEREIIDDVKKITGEIDLAMALQLTECSWHRDPPAIRCPSWIIHNALVIKLANYLSPIPAYLATVQPHSSCAKRISTMGQEFLSHITTHNYLPTPGDETENTADSSYYAQVAACGPKSYPLSVALDFIGIENYVISGKDANTSGHFWLYVKDCDFLVSNAQIAENHALIYRDRFKLIEYVGYKEEGLYFAWWNGTFESEGTLSPSVIIDLFEYAHRTYGEDIGGINEVNGQREFVPLKKVLDTLK